jgi:ferredoxin-NADP reductase
MAESHESFTARLARASMIASRTLFLEFDLPGAGMSFLPGQATTLTFKNTESTEDISRIFSLCSAPYELPRIGIATRLTGSVFKEHLERSRPGQEFTLIPPFGDFIPPDSLRGPSSCVFMAGGIGITPFRSLIREHLHKKDPGTFFLMTVNRSEADTPFLPDCRQWALAPGISWYPVVSQENDGSGSSSLPENGAQDPRNRQERIAAAIEQILEKAGVNPLFFIAGPPGMVDSLKQTLLGQFLVSSEQIRTDLFFGYGPR